MGEIVAMVDTTPANFSMDLMDISELYNPIQVTTLNVGWGLETIFQYKNNLFIGSQTGMYIYDLSDPAVPEQLSVFNHLRSCDPVVVDDDYAYVTLRSGTFCMNGNNQLDVGNIVSASSNQVLVNIKRIDTVSVYFTIPETDLDEVKTAMAQKKLEVDFSPEGDDKDIRKGVVTFIDNTVDESTGTVMMHADIDNTDKKLWSGQFGNVKLILKTLQDATLVPSQAVEIGQKGKYLFVVNQEGEAELRNIKVGEESGGFTVVTSGVTSGEKVVVQGQIGLSDGAKVFDAQAQAGKGK